MKEKIGTRYIGQNNVDKLFNAIFDGSTVRQNSLKKCYLKYF